MCVKRNKEKYQCIREKMAAQNIVKVIKQPPLQAWTGPEGSRRMRLPDFKTIST